MSKKLKYSLIAGGVLVLLIIAHAMPSGTIVQDDDPFVTKKKKKKRKKEKRINPKYEQTKKIAAWIGDKINSDKKKLVNAECKAVTIGVVNCKLRFSLDMDNLSVVANTRKLAELMGEIGIGAHVSFVGQKGYRRICEYSWDLLLMRVKGKVY